VATRKGRSHGQPFTCLIGNHPYGSFPDQNLPAFQAPTPVRRAFTHQVLTMGDTRLSAHNHIGLMVGTPAAKTATLTVADNDFSTGTAIITLGDYTLTSNVDYAVDAVLANTASNIAAAITALPGFQATALAGVVTILYTIGPADLVDFSVVYYGTKTNFTLTPTDGLMGNGGPHFGAIALI
jgi:hypothetical protein